MVGSIISLHHCRQKGRPGPAMDTLVELTGACHLVLVCQHACKRFSSFHLHLRILAHLGASPMSPNLTVSLIDDKASAHRPPTTLLTQWPRTSLEHFENRNIIHCKRFGLICLGSPQNMERFLLDDALHFDGRDKLYMYSYLKKFGIPNFPIKLANLAMFRD